MTSEQNLKNDITLYTTRFCPFCIRAKSLLERKNLAYNEIPVDGDPEKRAYMTKISGQRTVPQIWLNGKHIGGCDELYQLERSGELDDMLVKGK